MIRFFIQSIVMGLLMAVAFYVVDMRISHKPRRVLTLLHSLMLVAFICLICLMRAL